MGLVSFVSLEPECVECVPSVLSVPRRCRVSESRVSHVSSVHRLNFIQSKLCVDSSVECLMGLVSFIVCQVCAECARVHLGCVECPNLECLGSIDSSSCRVICV